MSFSSWTRSNAGSAGGSNGLHGCSTAFMAFDTMKHTSVNLQELGFARHNNSNHQQHHNGSSGRNDLNHVAHSPSHNNAGIWSSPSPSVVANGNGHPDSDLHDSWLRARRESSGSSADSGFARSGPGSFDDQHHLSLTMQEQQHGLMHPYGKIARPRMDSTQSEALFAGLKISASSSALRPGSPTLSASGSSTSLSSSCYDHSKAMFPLNPVAKDFVPAPKSWAAIAGAAYKAKKTGAVAAGAFGQLKSSTATGRAPEMAVLAPAAGFSWPTKAASPAKTTTTGSISLNLPAADCPPAKLPIPPATSSFIPAFIQAQHDRIISGASKSQPKSDSDGWTLMDGRSSAAAPLPLSKPAAAAVTDDEAQQRNKSKSPTLRGGRQSPESLVQRLRTENSFNNPDLKALELERARFFIMKPLSERDVFDSIVRSEWSGTAYGGELLDEVYQAHHTKGPVYLLFSVNGSGQFCGIAHMTSRVQRHANIWEAQRNNGKFKVKWDFVKDVPNAALRHINIDARGSKPVTNCRDATEMSPVEAVKVVKIIQAHESVSNVLESYVKDSHNKDRRGGGKRGGGGGGGAKR
ncbi:putative YTH domain-containing family protein 2 [Hypsibius exemplaris]|uniref:YTH domain-containing family protein 2 n=1 Tax=Hypsibius exemplaris TaxID=2072580 RepID=A0A1W0X4L0_HYPEX|nr:putative YTH domain-containing family protein 2 [Hypsibius exemplaris]